MASGAVLRGRIIGKQVKILYDLVTVCGERGANMSLAIAAGKTAPARPSRESGNLPEPVRGAPCAPDHEELVRMP